MSVFVAQLFPKEKVKDIKGASQAGINFCHSFIDAITPSRVYAYQLNSEKEKLQFFFENKKIIYICSRLFPHSGIGKIFNTIIENIVISFQIYKGKHENIWLYNLNIQVYLLFIILKFVFRKKVFLILADLTPSMKRTQIALRLAKKADGIISLTPEFKSHFERKTQVFVKAGIIEDSIECQNNLNVLNQKTFLFAGDLRRGTGIDLALATFAKLPHLNLWISGTGESLSRILEYQNKYSNIKYLGYLSMDKYYQLLATVDFVLSLRNEAVEENIYNFPSKIIEFFYHKKLVISTKRYTTLNESIYFISEYNVDSLSSKIKEVLSLCEPEVRTIQNKAHEFALNNFSKKSWANIVSELEKRA